MPFWIASHSKMAFWIQDLEKQPFNKSYFSNKFKLKAITKKISAQNGL